ncbi:MAG: 3-hydroxybutyryl-CoA dehydrogenase [bacterium]|jgi:3-hydroxybutyryl-CoA dehydrogenase
MGASGISKIGVIGIGTMGNGIAQVSAQCGFDTIVIDVSEEVVAKGLAKIHKSLERLVASYEKSGGAKGISAEAAAEAKGRLKTGVATADLLGCDIIIEAIIENYEAKAAKFKELSELGFSGILASNTSSISITKLASCYAHPEKFMGMHFMNPVPLQPGVELIRGFLTSDETSETVTALTRDLGKEPIKAEDKAGFGINRMFVPFCNEAYRVVEEGIMSVEDCDKTTLCLGHKMGPLTTSDYVGLDTMYYITHVLWAEFGDAYRPSPLLTRLFEAGHFGIKTGKGFYIYDEQGNKIGVNPAVARYRIGG